MAHWLQSEALASLDATDDATARADTYQRMNARLRHEDESGPPTAAGEADRTLQALRTVLLPLASHLRRDLVAKEPQVCVSHTRGRACCRKAADPPPPCTRPFPRAVSTRCFHAPFPRAVSTRRFHALFPNFPRAGRVFGASAIVGLLLHQAADYPGSGTDATHASAGF